MKGLLLAVFMLIVLGILGVLYQVLPIRTQKK
jgi:hypothetical protein